MEQDQERTVIATRDEDDLPVMDVLSTSISPDGFVWLHGRDNWGSSNVCLTESEALALADRIYAHCKPPTYSLTTKGSYSL